MAQDWQGFLVWLFDGAADPTGGPAEMPLNDLDFLTGATEPALPAQRPLERRASKHLRRREAEAFAMQALIDMARQQPLHWLRDPRLPDIDGEATWLLLQLVVALPRPSADTIGEHGPLSQLLERALQSPELPMALAAVRAAEWTAMRGLQATVAGRFHRNLTRLDAESRTSYLDCLQAIGDGRCVRPLEALLADCGTLLDDHQAWRTRHIVQVIRRAGRK